jgi:hypothetical protein
MATRFGRHKWWVLTVLLTVPVVAIAAGVPNVFTAGTVISSQQVNDNFKNLSDRVTALEAAKTTLTVLMDNQLGPLPDTGLTKTFVSTGGMISLLVSGSGWINGSGGLLDVAVQLDGATIGHLKTSTNEPNSHRAYPTRIFQPAATPAAGNHVVTLVYGAGSNTTSDAADFFSVTVIETH